MPRWSRKETADIAIVRQRCAEKLAASPQFPEVIGDRKIIRFLRGHDHNIDKVVEMVNKFLDWRKANNVDEIRTNIVERGMDHPAKFPKGELILQLIPQLVIGPDAQCMELCPICVEQYNFVPSQVLKAISIEDYVLFVTYSLEYKSIILEQMSEERERQFLSTLTAEERRKADEPHPQSDSEINSSSSNSSSSNSNNSNNKKTATGDIEEMEPYGTLLHTVVIRDLTGVGFAHLGSQGQEIIKSVVAVASDNYPELMRKCFMVNTPMVFNTVWWMIKGLLAARTAAKVSVRGANYKSELLREIDEHSLPEMVGGKYRGYQEYQPFPFNHDFLCPHLNTTTATAAVEGKEEPPVGTAVTSKTNIATADSSSSNSSGLSSLTAPAAVATVATLPTAAEEEESLTPESDPNHINIIALRTSGH